MQWKWKPQQRGSKGEWERVWMNERKGKREGINEKGREKKNTANLFLNLAIGSWWCDHRMKKFGIRLCTLNIIMRILAESRNEGNDTKALRRWLGSVGIKEAALALFPLVNVCEMYHLWRVTGSALAPEKTLFPSSGFSSWQAAQGLLQKI